MVMVAKVKKEKTESMDKSFTGVKSRAKKTVPAVDNTSALVLNKIIDDNLYASVFNEPRNSSLTAQYVRTYQFNQRKGNAQTKTRGDVAGSGKKPWKQKGTGRSRVGSIRTPVWRHGGVSHGPIAKDWGLDMPKKMKAKAFLIALSDKVMKSQAYFIEEFNINEGRTKEVLALTGGWKLSGKIVLIIDQKNQNLQKGAGNLQNVEVVSYKNLNTYQILGADSVVFEKNALDSLVTLRVSKEKYAKSE